MPFLRVECAGCHSVLSVRAELAGQQGKCPKCGAVTAIPLAPAATEGQESPASQAPLPNPPRRGEETGEIAASAGVGMAPANAPPAAKSTDSAVRATAALPLGQATALDMMAEIFRRKRSAVMIVFETPKIGTYALSQRPDANVRCYRTADMTDAQMMQVLEHVGYMSQGKRNQKGGVGLESGASTLPFELKGDRLGMTLDEFKAKYARKAGSFTLPYTSESCAGQANSSLRSEPWHVAAGLVNARVDLPSEGNPPTIAGVKTELMLYHFVDGRLFCIMAHFDTEAFGLIRDALVGKYGTPTTEIKDPMELEWENPVSTMTLVRGTMRPKKSSMLLLVHDELQKSAEGRMPKREADL